MYATFCLMYATFYLMYATFMQHSSTFCYVLTSICLFMCAFLHQCVLPVTLFSYQIWCVTACLPTVSVTQCCAGIMYHDSGIMWLCILQYGSMVCIHGSMMCIRHQYGLYQAYMSQYGSILCIRHHNDGHNVIWFNAVLGSLYGPMLCIRHHNRAQTSASCINMAEYCTTLHTKLTTSYFVHFLFCYLALSTERRGIKMNKFGHVRFATVTVHFNHLCRFIRCGRACK